VRNVKMWNVKMWECGDVGMWECGNEVHPGLRIYNNNGR